MVLSAVRIANAFDSFLVEMEGNLVTMAYNKPKLSIRVSTTIVLYFASS